MLRVVENDPDNLDLNFQKVEKMQIDGLSKLSLENQEPDYPTMIQKGMSDYLHCTIHILEKFDSLINEHVQLKSNSRVIEYENEKLRQQLQMLKER
jgi:hypothetical protein